MSKKTLAQKRQDYPSRDYPTQALTQREFTPDDFTQAKRIAVALGYGDEPNAAYTSTSALWGLFCMALNPEHAGKSRQLAHTLNPNAPPWIDGCIIATRELGLLFVVLAEDIRGIER